MTFSRRASVAHLAAEGSSKSSRRAGPTPRRSGPAAATVLAAARAGRVSLAGGWLRADARARAWLGLPSRRLPWSQALRGWPADAAGRLQQALDDSVRTGAAVSLLLVLGDQVLHLQGGRLRQAVHLLVLPAPPQAAPLDFLAAASHELRTPLQALLGFAAQAKAGGGDAALAGITQAATLLGHRVDDLLDFTRLRAGRLALLDDEPIDLHALFERLTTLADSLGSHKPLRIRTRIDPACPPHLHGDARRLEQLLVNLLGNAIKYTEAGTIVLKARLRQVQGQQVTLRLAVADTGMGIAGNRLDRIGRPFEQAGRGGPGSSGLGLAVVQELLALFGSTLKLASVAGGGSIFWFDVVLQQADAATVASSQLLAREPMRALPQACSGQPAQVLVVDDSDIVQLALQAQLEALGAQVQVAGDVAAALAAGQARAFDLVLTDLQLPDAPGLDLLRQWQQRWPAAPTRFALLSGHIPAAVRDEARALGVLACLTKPCQADTLQALLNSLQAASPPAPPVPDLRQLLARSWVARRRHLASLPPGSVRLCDAVHGLRGELALLPGHRARAAWQAAAALEEALRAGRPEAEAADAVLPLLQRVDALLQRPA